MTIRPPAVAGSFYEGTPPRLRAQVDACFRANPPAAAKQRFIGAVVPHAGLMYSGRVAAAFYDAAELPRRFIILCPNHTGAGHFAAINSAGAWRTPLGEAAIDAPLADALRAKSAFLAEDARAHAREHSLEVQLPFLQYLLGDAFTFVPVCLGAHRYDIAEDVGRAVADVIREANEPVGILASSDLNHYEDQQTTLRKDQLALDEVLARNPRELWRVVDEYDVSMCGFIPTTAMLVAANALGASESQLLMHATSGDVNGDYGHVVGYASVLIR
ncbi:MAG: AmmeMemoRadiSam system protein B [Acidobacteria bacterium]|nr:AmmeMemoRadiSam system protein B [Acidobacteriota bacterium]MBV9475766.1 AmmeMemoRadiSam system protein B [Acidobacteriota bacterium]